MKKTTLGFLILLVLITTVTASRMPAQQGYRPFGGIALADSPTPVNVSLSSTDSDWPCLGVDGNGAAYVVWIEHQFPRNFYFSTNKNGSWSTPEWVEQIQYDAEEAGYPWMSVSPSGACHLVFQDGRVVSYDIYHRAYASGWGTTTNVSNNDGGSAYSGVAVSPVDNYAYVVWQDGTGREWGWNILLRYRSPAGGWSSTQMTPFEGYMPQIAIDAAGTAHLMWTTGWGRTLWYSKNQTPQNASSWTQPTLIKGDVGEDWSYAKVASDNAGNAYVIWMDGTVGNDEIFLRKVNSNGTLGPEINVSQSAANSQEGAVAVDKKNGNIIIAWKENNDIYANAFLGGIWSGPGNITNGLAPSKMPSVAVDSFGGAHLAFSAYVNGNWEILYMVEAAAAMAVTPTTGFTSSGLAGGPFSPANTDYLIQNTGGAGMNWTAAKTASATWLTLSATSGYLSAGNAATLTASINSLANSLPAGLYSATITFTNTTNGVGNTTRSVTLYVNAAPTLVVTPAEGLTSQGLPGGPFSPSSKVYTLQNTGGASLNWTAAKTKTWVTLSGTSGTLSSGGSTNVTVSINSNANSLSIGEYTDTVTFTNTTNGVGNTTRPVNLTVGQKMWITVRGTDNWLYSRSMNQLEALTGWTRLKNGMTDSTPATAMFNNKFYVVVKSSSDTKIWWNRMDSGGVWGSWQVMDGFTGDKPFIAVFNNRLYIAVRGTDDKIYVRYMNTAETLYPWQAVPGGLTSIPPAIQGFNDKLYLVVKDSGDNKIWWNKMDTAGTWSSWSLMDGLSPSTAAMAVFNSQLYIAVRGADDRLYHRSMNTSELFTSWGWMAGFTTVSPAIEAFNSKLYMCVKSNVDTKIYWNAMNTSGVWGVWTLMDGATPSTPALAGPIY